MPTVPEPTGHVITPPSKGSPAFKQAATDGKADEVEWLKDIVHKQPGWEIFFNSINHNLQNPEVVRSWQFAVTFAREYSKTDSKCPVSLFLLPFCDL